MNKFMDKITHGRKLSRKSNTPGAMNTETELSEVKRFYSQFEPKMMACLQPSNRVRAQMAIKNLGGKSKNQNLYPYEEKHFASFVNKQSEHIGGNLRGALQAMGVTYQQVADLKSTRDSSIKTDVIKPMNEITLKELSNLQKLRKTCSDAQRELTAAEKNRNNVGDQASIERREKALRAHTEANTRLQNAISDFRRDEPKRLLVLQSAAEIQLDYYKKAMEAFQNLVQELSSIILLRQVWCAKYHNSNDVSSEEKHETDRLCLANF